MKNKPIIAGNWKMNKSNLEAKSFVSDIQNRILDKGDTKVIFCPPFTSLFTIVDSPADGQLQECRLVPDEWRTTRPLTP